jgi:histidinol-phosphate aminotransferase
MYLSEQVQQDLLARGFTRRHFGRILTLLTAGASMPMYNEASLAHAQLSSLNRRLPPGAVKINANENPEGPPPSVLDALMTVAKRGNRYQYEETDELLEAAAKKEGLTAKEAIAYPGSSLGLHHAIVAFTSPEHGLITVDPGYEAATRAASWVGAPVVRVPLRKSDLAHDVKAMVEQANKSNAGVIYICNPNNPTGTVTKRADIDYVVANKPKGAVVLIDEAYIHFSDEPFASDLVKKGEDVLILRTFSKLYGMAGLRAGFMYGKQELLSKVAGFNAGGMPATAMIAARTAMADTELVAARKKKTAAIRNDMFAFFDKHGFKYTPSQSNKFMVDVRMPVEGFISAMAEHHIYVGRPWKSWPTWNRISLGTAEEMEKVKTAFLKVVSS